MMLIGLSGIWILLTNSAHQENREFRVQLQKQIAAGTESQIHSIGKVARDYALWNEFDEKINRPRPDMVTRFNAVLPLKILNKTSPQTMAALPPTVVPLVLAYVLMVARPIPER